MSLLRFLRLLFKFSYCISLNLLLVATAAQAGTTNTVGYTESFESYTNGFQISGTNGWGAVNPAAGMVTTNVTDNGGSYPLPGSHTNVLQITDEITNTLVSPTGGVVVLDFMAMPSGYQWDPMVSTNWQYAFYLNASSNLVLWHYNKTAVSNEWTVLAGGPVVTNGIWTRFTVIQDYSRAMLQMRVNNGAWITNAEGWTTGGSAGGSWFYMAQTNVVYTNMTLLGIAEAQTNYVDDIVLTNRQVTWSASGFTEGVTNNGAVMSTLSVGLFYDTFTGSNGDDFVASNKLQVANLPSNLTAVATYSSPTQLTVRLNGMAVQHEAVNSTNLVFAFQNTAFTLGNAANVYRYSNSLSLTFSNTPALSYSRTNFNEDSVANDGSIDNSTLMIITLTNALFAGTVGDDFYQQGKVQVINLPSNLVAVLMLTNQTQLSVILTNKATLGDAVNNLSNLTFTFLSAAFSNVPDYSVVGVSCTNLSITFLDPTVAPTLQYGATVFAENPANDGTVTGTALALSGKTFAGTNNENYVASGKAVVANVPGGLTLQLVQTGPYNLMLGFAGHATNHLAFNSVSNLTVTFTNSAFTTGGAASVSNSVMTNLVVQFHDQPYLTWNATIFTEAAANDGSIATTNTVTLTDPNSTATFSNVVFTAGNQFTTPGVPAGLSCVVWYVNSSTVKMAFGGHAAAHATNDNTSFSLQFQNAAFNTVGASNITGSTSGLSITYSNQPSLSWDSTIFTEAAANDGSIATTNTVTLSGGATFTGGNYTLGNQYTTSGVPAGLSCVVWNQDATHIKVALSGNAAAHTAANNTGFTLQFQNAAFNTVGASNITGSTSGLSITYSNQPSLSWDSTIFTEAAANDGSIATTNTVTLGAGATFVSGAYTEGTQFTTSGGPAALSCSVWYVNSLTVKVALSGNAPAHAAANSTNFTLQFQNAAFYTVGASNITGSTTNLAVQFADPAQLTYSSDTFTELSQGTINNIPPITITLSGDTFTGANGVDFTAVQKVVVLNLPVGLTAVVGKTSDTVLSLTLTGSAYLNDSANNVTNLTFQFQDTAFSNVAAARVVNVLKPDLKIIFTNDSPFAYTVPYEEPFESFNAGAWIALVTNGWSAEYPGAGTVIAETSLTSGEHAYPYGWPLPVSTNHAQTLYVQSDIQNEIHSAPGQMVYLDFMMWPTPMVDVPQVTTNMQFAFYVSTNSELVLWHKNCAGTPTNELRVLTNALGISTNRWMRLTVCQDYSNAMFQVQVDDCGWITDAAGWTVPGTNGVLGGTWFHMVQTNRYMSRFGVAGVGSAYFDDLTVRTSFLNHNPSGSIFTIR